MFGVQTLYAGYGQNCNKRSSAWCKAYHRTLISRTIGKAQPNVYFHKMVALPVVESSISIYPDFKKYTKT